MHPEISYEQRRKDTSVRTGFSLSLSLECRSNEQKEGGKMTLDKWVQDLGFRSCIKIFILRENIMRGMTYSFLSFLSFFDILWNIPSEVLGNFIRLFLFRGNNGILFQDI